MQPSGPRCFGRRTVLQTLGTSLVAASIAGTATGQSDSASVEFVDQESDGQSVVIRSLEIPVDGELLIMTGDTIYRDLQLDAGTSFTDRRVELSQPIEESTVVRAQLQSETDYLTDEQALVAVDESLKSARSSFSIPGGDIEIIDPDPELGFHLPYALYTPDTTIDGIPIYVEPLNNTDISSRAALREELRAASIISVAEDLRLPALVPGLPYLRPEGNDEVASLELPSVNRPGRLGRIETDDFPAESLRRVDRQVVEMIRDAKDRLADAGYSVASTVHMQGFSASAQFASRFAFLYPQLINTLTLGGNGAYPLPKATHEGAELPYPLGTANYESITGRAFDRERWAQITQYIYVGREDQPSSGNESDYYSISHAYEERAVSVFGKNRVTERFPTTQTAYEAVNADATFRIYDGLGHETSDQTQNAIKNTHQQSLDSAAEWPTPTNLLLELPDPTPTPTETPTATPSDTPISTPGDTPSADTGEATTTGASGPGFGPLTAVTSLGGLGYLLARRFQHKTEE